MQSWYPACERLGSQGYPNEGFAEAQCSSCPIVMTLGPAYPLSSVEAATEGHGEGKAAIGYPTPLRLWSLKYQHVCVGECGSICPRNVSSLIINSL